MITRRSIWRRIAGGVVATGCTLTLGAAQADAAGTAIEPASLPSATINQPYSVQLQVVPNGVNPTPPIRWSSDLRLPSWLTLSQNGVLSGTAPAMPQSAQFDILAVDAADVVAFRTYTLTVGTGTSLDSVLVPLGDQVNALQGAGPEAEAQIAALLAQINGMIATLANVATCPLRNPAVVTSTLNTLLYGTPPSAFC
jgi:hypothetical protein